MRLIFFLYIIFVVKIYFAQTNTYFGKAEIKIGEQTELTLELIFDKNEGVVNFIPLQKSIICYKKFLNGTIDSTKKFELEIMSKFKDSIQIHAKNKLKWIGKYVVTSWDSGVFILPKLSIATQKQVYYFNFKPLKVDFPKVKAGEEIFDIKEQFVDLEEQSWLQKNWYFVVIAIVLVLLLINFYRRYLKKSKSLPLPEMQVSLLDKINTKLKALEEEKLWEREEFKKHYMAFTYIMKLYLSEKFSIAFFEKTSYETNLLLSQKGISKVDLENITKILENADLVKFAKTKPTSKDVFQHLETFRRILNKLENGTT